jgi:hypothetical protein
MTSPIRIAMWSGPRNISTAMMRSFEARGDCHVVDEPFYAAFLSETGIDHPMTAETLASQPNDWRDVVRELSQPATDKPIVYEKHMTHHMLPGFELDWMGQCRNAFLIRDPVRVLASYTQKREDVTLADIGFVQQAESLRPRSRSTWPCAAGDRGRRCAARSGRHSLETLRCAWYSLDRQHAELACRHAGDGRRVGAGLV